MFMSAATYPKNVLLVISNREKLQAIASSLLNHKLSVDAVPNTYALLQRLEENAVDVIISELDSPWIEWQALMQLVETVKPGAKIKFLWLGEIFNPKRVAAIINSMLNEQ